MQRLGTLVGVALLVQLSDDEGKQLRTDYDQALKSTMGMTGQAAILLQIKISDLLKRLPTDLANASFKGKMYPENIENRGVVVRDAKDDVVKIAKVELGIT